MRRLLSLSLLFLLGCGSAPLAGCGSLEKTFLGIERTLAPRSEGGDGVVETAAAVVTALGGPIAGGAVTLAGTLALAAARAYNRRGKLVQAWGRAIEDAPHEVKRAAQAEARAASVHGYAEEIACKAEHASANAKGAKPAHGATRQTRRGSKPGGLARSGMAPPAARASAGGRRGGGRALGEGSGA